MKQYEAPTKKQQAFVEDICAALNITDFPSCSAEFTKARYSAFISANIRRFMEGTLAGQMSMFSDSDEPSYGFCGDESMRGMYD